jgi:hypothetical protein
MKDLHSLRGQLVLGEGCCSSARDPFRIRALLIALECGGSHILERFAKTFGPLESWRRLLMVTYRFATFQTAIASHKCAVAVTLKEVVITQGESWLDWEFWK